MPVKAACPEDIPLAGDPTYYRERPMFSDNSLPDVQKVESAANGPHELCLKIGYIGCSRIEDVSSGKGIGGSVVFRKIWTC